MKYISAIFIGAILALTTAVGFSAVSPAPAQAYHVYTHVKTCAGKDFYLNPYERRVFDLQNQARRSRGMVPLCVNPNLTWAARVHSKEMIDRDYFSHNSYNGESFSNRLKRFGYTPNGFKYWSVGENIAGGNGPYAAADNTFSRWMNSPGHRANILNSNFREVGIGTHMGVYRGMNGYRMYTVDFGVRR